MIYFISDVHLGFNNKTENKKNEDQFINFLNDIENDCSILVMLGDIFDYWFEYKYTIPKYYYRTLAKLKQFAEKEIEIIYIMGNHDFGHKTFLVIADYLTRRGIAVLRFDDRGVGQSTGNFSGATTADFATDVESAVAYLKNRREINPQKIGLIGHSEGGAIAPIVAARSCDVAFIVMLAGPGLRGDVVLLQQCEMIHRVSGMPEDKIIATCGVNAKIFEHIINSQELVSLQEIAELLTGLKSEIEAIMPEGMSIDDFIRLVTAQMSSPWMQYFLRFDPAPTLEQVRVPVLAVNGSKDLQVSARENLEAIRTALERGGNQNVTIIEYPRLNHLFQECTTGLPEKYAAIEQTFSPEVLKDIADWILKQ